MKDKNGNPCFRDLREFRHKNEAAASRMGEEARAAAAEIAALRSEVARRAEVAQRMDNGQHDSEIKVQTKGVFIPILSGIGI